MTKPPTLEPNIDPNYLSDCHNAAVYVVGTGEGTNHYECLKCRKPCNFHPLEPIQGKNLFKFKLRIDDISLTPEHPDQYHSTATVVSDAANGAFDIVLTILGKPATGRDWMITIQSIDEVIDMAKNSPDTNSRPSNPQTPPSREVEGV